MQSAKVRTVSGGPKMPTTDIHGPFEQPLNLIYYQGDNESSQYANVKITGMEKSQHSVKTSEKRMFPMVRPVNDAITSVHRSEYDKNKRGLT